MLLDKRVLLLLRALELHLAGDVSLNLLAHLIDLLPLNSLDFKLKLLALTLLFLRSLLLGFGKELILLPFELDDLLLEVFLALGVHASDL